MPFTIHRRRFGRLAAAALVLSLGSAPAALAQAPASLTLVAPAAPGGGWDQTARAMQAALEGADVVPSVQVVNVTGAGGTIGLARFVAESSASPDTILVSGLIMVGGVLTNKSAVTLDQVTPLARLTGEWEMIAVPAASPIQSIGQLVEQLKADPGAVSWGGGSAGGTDHMLVGLVAQAAGVDPTSVNYIAHSGGGESLASIMGGFVTAGINGVAEFAPQIESGALRPLAVSSDERLPAYPDVPTLKESGLDVSLLNWRGLMVGANVPEAERTALAQAVDAMAKSPAWQDELTKRGWVDMYQPQAEFAPFLDAEQQKVAETLRAIGLTQ
ncbi:tripartite tricarboxylate transporter substrate binding protein [Aureimonas jatrophae]|uniref:Putative tricarboxylic transport membrane protein n=1 Tax=Aureimonas jatrophae TaxID=1166073 RepID=A0A1H0EQ21_9HYPH|nr:tripartite tricarboxylate transporter substrate-binding protein [Aureimonas jatrophae]MBB3950381.1 putative tricarboxylic transport membrane protein [Aureimonas jatrophae]SDN84393.1 putative tricarboxylic transport membrane protein [Aureimonas jatrophae]